MGVNQFTDVSDKESKRRRMSPSEIEKLILHLQANEETVTIPQFSSRKHDANAFKSTKALDLREAKPPVLTRVKNQGVCGGCRAFVIVSLLESFLASEGHPLTEGSVQQIIACDKTSDGCQGGIVGNAFDYLKASGGLYTEKQYPYQELNNRNLPCQKCKTAKDIKGKPFLKATKEVSVMTCDTQTLMLRLELVGPIGSVCSAEGWDQYTGGVFDLPFSMTSGLDHTAVIVGFGTDTKEKRDFWIVRNSQGPTWGAKGHILILREQKVAKHKFNKLPFCGASGLLTGLFYYEGVPV